MHEITLVEWHVRWDGKLLPRLDVRSSKETHLLILMSIRNEEQFLVVPKLDSSTGKGQDKDVSNALYDANINDKWQIMCCDMTASNTGHLNRACVLYDKNKKKSWHSFLITIIFKN